MLLTIGNLRQTVKPQKPKIFLARPNKRTIAKLTEAYNISSVINLGGINELQFDLPFQIDIDNELVDNKNILLLRNRYLIKFIFGDFSEWYIITKLEDISDDTTEVKRVYAKSLGYELRDKQIKIFSTKDPVDDIDTPINCTTALTRALEETLWSVGYVDGDFDVQFRTFDTSGTVLDIITNIAETYNSVIVWDTDKRKIDMRKPDLIGINKGLKLSYNNYLKGLTKEYNSDEMVTRLKVFGRDGLSIQRVNPTGTNYLEDFSYFLYPFQRDPVTKEVIRHSDYMSDELCNAILDYNELVASKQGEFRNYLNEKDNLQWQLSQLETELFDIETQLNIAKDNEDVQHAVGTINKTEIEYTGTSKSYKYTLSGGKRHAILIYASTTDNINISYNGSAVTLEDDKWTVIAKKSVSSNTKETISISGSGDAIIRVQTVSILDSENNDTDIINKYCAWKWEDEYNYKTKQANRLLDDIDDIDNRIDSLRHELAVENNFTAEQIIERNQFIIEKEWTDTNYIDDELLYKDAVKKFEELREPQTVIDIDIVNFLEIVEAQRDWDKLSIGDTVTIEYERIGVKATAKIIQISFDFESGTIRLTIANTKDIKSDEEKLIKMLYQSISTSTTVDMNKFKWDGAASDTSDIRKLLQSKWDASKREIEAGVNESVTINARGITITDPSDPNNFLRATHGVLAITNDGGNTFKHAITKDGIIAERLYGQIIIGQNLTIGDETGTFNIVGNKLTVKDNNDKTRVELGEYTTGKYGLRITSKTDDSVVLDEDGMLQTWQIQEADNADSAHPVVLKVYIPQETRSIKKVLLNFTLEKFRAYSKGAEAGGEFFDTVSQSSVTRTVTSSDGGGDYITSEYDGGQTSYYASGWDWRNWQTGEAILPNGRHGHGIIDGTDLMTADGSSVTFHDDYGHIHFFCGNHLHDIPSHDHDIELPDHDHTVTITIPSHSHDIDIPDHEHDIEYGIYEDTAPSKVTIVINGVDRTSSLGGGTGFTTNQTNLNITNYLSIGQWNTIELTSNRNGRINATIFVQAFISM